MLAYAAARVSAVPPVPPVPVPSPTAHLTGLDSVTARLDASIANLDPALVASLDSLEPGNVGATDLAEVLSRFPAPRIVALQGSIALVTMEPLAEFLVAMGYPEERLRNPADGRSTYDSFVDAARLAGHLAWHFEQEAMMPMLIGHSQGGMVVVKVLHELAGRFRESIAVWNPHRQQAEDRTAVIDPVNGTERSVVGMTIGYAAAIATGSLPRLILGQWGTQVAWYKGTNNGFKLVDTALVTIPHGSNTVPTLGDLDGDGKLDLLVGEASGWIDYYHNVGTKTKPKFTLVSDRFNDLNPGRRSRPALVDVTGDGVLDLVVGRESGGIAFYRNAGTRTAPRFVEDASFTLALPPISTPVAVDLEGTGRPLIISGGVSGGLVIWK